MLTVGGSPIYLYRDPVDMRRSFDGLSALVESGFPGKLLTGGVFVFVNRRRDLLKLLYWDEDRLAQWYKRLEAGTFNGGKPLVPVNGVVSLVMVAALVPPPRTAQRRSRKVRDRAPARAHPRERVFSPALSRGQTHEQLGYGERGRSLRGRRRQGRDHH